MFSRSHQSFLRDILENAEMIRHYLSGVSLQQYLADPMRRDAVERRFQILTEAASRLGDAGPKLCPDVDWRSIRGFGNMLRHEYDKVSDLRVWEVIQHDLSPLENAVRAALATLFPPPSNDRP